MTAHDTKHDTNVLTQFSQLLEAAKRPDEKRHIKSLGMDVFVRHMSADERDSYEASFLTKGEVDPTKLYGIRQRLIVIGLSDGNGARIAKATDLDKLPAAVVDELAEAIGDVNGINKKSKDEAGNDSAKTGD